MEEEEDATFTVHDVLDAMEHLTPMYRAVQPLCLDNWHQEISDRLESVLNLEVESQGQAKLEPFIDPIRKHPPCRVNIHLTPNSSNSLSSFNLTLKGIECY